MIKEHNSVMAMDVHAFMAWPCLRDTDKRLLVRRLLCCNSGAAAVSTDGCLCCLDR